MSRRSSGRATTWAGPWTGHDFGELFRLLSKHLGANQTRIGTATGLAQGTVCAIMNGRRQVTAIDVLERIADGLGMPDTAWLRLDLARRVGRVRPRCHFGSW